MTFRGLAVAVHGKPCGRAAVGMERSASRARPSSAKVSSSLYFS